jgi:tRNA 2-selenouridine synthase
MSPLPQNDDFRSIVLNETPLIDVRAPVEFAKGSFPHAVNLPLMDDEERRLVGITYKERGNTEAIKLGHTLVSGELKASRIKAWNDFIDAHPDAKLYCFRGGQRSQISQEWIAQSGREIVRLKGGYKAFRNYLMEETERSITRFKPLVLGGRTGSGKTILLHQLENAIDLEGLANHRGSSFGRTLVPQPSQIDFENALAYALIQKLEAGYGTLVFEDEGRGVGRVYLPRTLSDYLAQAPLVILDTPLEKRVEITFEEYVTSAQIVYEKVFGDEGVVRWVEDMRAAMKRIERRLGGLRYKEVTAIFDDAYAQQCQSGTQEAYKVWVAYLLETYYDPMYDYQIEKNAARIVFRGDADAVLAYLRNHNGQ